MDESPTIAAENQVKCQVAEQIDAQQVAVLLRTIYASLMVPIDNVKTAQESQFKLDPTFFSRHFLPETNQFVYLLSERENRDKELPRNFLTRKDVLELLESLIDAVERNRFEGEVQFSEPEKIAFDQVKYNRVLNQRIPLSEIVIPFVTFFEHLIAPKSEEETKYVREFDLELPENYKDLLKNFDLAKLKEQWPKIKQLPQSILAASKNTSEYISLPDEKIFVSIIAVRQYLNEWVHKLYETELRKALEKRGIQYPLLEFFADQKTYVAFIDIPIANQFDFDVATFFLERINKLVLEIIELPPVQAPSGSSVGATDQEAAEGADTPLTQNLTPEESAQLVLNGHDQYQMEKQRLRSILFRQFFQLHGIDQDLLGLERLDPLTYAKLEREFESELNNVLRSLTAEELQGSTLELRLKILRRLFGKLSTNAKFIANLQEYKAKYVETLSDNQKQHFEQFANLEDEAFDKNIESRETNAPSDWLKDTVLSANLGAITGATRKDFETLFKHFLGAETNLETLFIRIDALVAERWSPDKIFNISDVASFKTVFAIDLPPGFLDGTSVFSLNQLLTLISEYMYARRRHLAERYQLDAVSRESDEQPNLPLSPKDSQKLEQTAASIEKHKAFGLGEAVIVARASDRNRVNEYTKNGNPLAPGIAAAHEEVTEERKQNLKEKYATLSLRQKFAFLQELGAIGNDIPFSEVSQDPETVEQIYSREQDQYINEYLNLIEQSSAYEDQDGVVNQAAGGEIVSHRYSAGTQAHSLMKGGVQVQKHGQDTSNFRKKVDLKASLAEEAEKAITGALLGPVAALPKDQRRLTVAGMFGAVSQLGHIIQTSLAAQVGAAIGGGIGFLIGGVPGALIGSTTVGLGSYYLFDPAAKAATGSFTSSAAAQFSSTNSGLRSLGQNIQVNGPGLSAPKLSDIFSSAPTNASLITAAKTAITPYLIPIAITTGISVMSIMSLNEILAAFVPPNQSAILAGASSPLQITKLSLPATGVVQNTKINYTITLSTKIADGKSFDSITISDQLDKEHLQPGSITIDKIDPASAATCTVNQEQFQISCTAPKLSANEQIVIQYSATTNDKVSADGKTPVTNNAKACGKLDGTEVCDDTLSTSNGDGDLVAKKSMEITGGLKRAWWGFYNYHTSYPQHFRPNLYALWGQGPPPCPDTTPAGQCPNPEPGGAGACDPRVAGACRSPNIMFWCTWNVIYAFQLAGRPIANPASPGGMTGVTGMRAYFRKQVYFPDPKVTDIQVGDVAFYGAGSDVDAHVAIVTSVTPSEVVTSNSNSRVVMIRYSVIGGKVQPLGGIYLNGIGRLR